MLGKNVFVAETHMVHQKTLHKGVYRGSKYFPLF